MKQALVRAMTAAAWLGLGSLTAGLAHATPISQTSTMTAASLVFNDFSCSITKGGLSASPSRCSQIDVAADSGKTGFDTTSNFSAAPLSFDTATLGFHVHSTGTRIDDIAIDFDGTFLGLSVAQVTETVQTSAGLVVGVLNLSCSAAGCDRADPSYELLDLPLLGAYTDLYVTDVISVTGALGGASIGSVQQDFYTASAAPGANVPEPASLALLGLGSLGLGWSRRRAARKGA